MASLFEGVAQYFGYELKKPANENIASSFAAKKEDDGAVVVAAGGSYGTYVDLDGTVRTEAELVNKYRDMSLNPEIDSAIEDIINEAIIVEDGEKTVELIFDENFNISPKMKQVIEGEFDYILQLLEFNTRSYDVFKRWYVDGRLYYHAMVPDNAPQNGIVEMRYLDPRRMRKIREVAKVRDKTNPQVVLHKTVKEYFMYSEKELAGGTKTLTSDVGTAGIKIAKDSIIHCTSGLVDKDGTMVIGFLHKAVKALNQLRALEDATIIYRISRAPERRIFYIDVGNLPKIKAEQYIRDMMVKHKNKLVYDSTTGEIRDDRKFMCYALDTKIPLLDGRTLELQELIAEYEQGKTNWVYSCDPVTGKFAPGPVSWAGITKENSDVVRVVFDNGKSVVCTPDHKFPVWNEGFVEAKDLIGKSIIPGYRRTEKIGKLEYEQLYKNETKTWEFTHRLVSEWKDENKLLNEWTYDEKFAQKAKKTVHHKNYNRYDNTPENLIRMNSVDHVVYHRSLNQQRWQDADFRSQVSNKLMAALKGRKFSDPWKSKLSKAKIGKVSAKDLTTGKNIVVDQHDFNINDNLVGQNSGKVAFSKTYKVTKPDGEIEIIENLSRYCRENKLSRSNILYWKSKGFKAELLHNHKVVSVQPIHEKMIVGCITVDLQETYHSNHTYLLDAGVYTKNTMLEDYWLPRREGGKGTEISTLPAGQNLGELSDVQYFQRKLYKSLNVPINRLEPENVYNVGRATEISRDEIKFAKFIDRLRTRFAQLFLNALEKQLILKMIVSPDDWAAIKPHIQFRFLRDNYFSELKESEILAARFDRLTQVSMFVGRYYSNTWVRKHILQQTEEDIEQLDSEIAQEMTNPQYMQPLMPGMDGGGTPGPDTGAQ